MDETHRSVSVNGVNTHYVEAGAGRPLILIHGLGASMVAWDKNIGFLSRFCHVYALDLPGHGDSDKPRDIAYDTFSGAHFMAAFMDTIGVSKADVVGNSAGGHIAARLALTYPQRVGRLVLVDSGGSGSGGRLVLKAGLVTSAWGDAGGFKRS